MPTDGDASKHVLVVNDTEEIIELFRDIIEQMGHRVSATTYAPEDLAEVRKVNPDLVIMDLVMDGERYGWQLTQKIRMSRDLEAIPIIICTAATDVVREQEGWLTANGVKVVLKPFTVSDLELAITKALKLPEILVDGSADTDGGASARAG
jgi:CheY-like chemotaxis protein